MVTKKVSPKVARRFWAKVQKTDACWNWTACKTHDGYGRFQLNGKARMAHRLAYRWLVGEIAPGLTLDHLCRNRACVNPAHLEVVTIRENVLRGEGVAAVNFKMTHCSKGHLLVPGYGQRFCRVCQNESKRRYRERQKQLQSQGGRL